MFSSVNGTVRRASHANSLLFLQYGQGGGQWYIQVLSFLDWPVYGTGAAECTMRQVRLPATEATLPWTTAHTRTAVNNGSCSSHHLCGTSTGRSCCPHRLIFWWLSMALTCHLVVFRPDTAV